MYKQLNTCVQMVIVLSSRDKSLILALIRVYEYSRPLVSRFSILDPRFSILDSRVSKLERLDLRDARIEFRGSSRDCQLTFERYCKVKYNAPLKTKQFFLKDSSQVQKGRALLGYS